MHIRITQKNVKDEIEYHKEHIDRCMTRIAQSTGTPAKILKSMRREILREFIINDLVSRGYSGPLKFYEIMITASAFVDALNDLNDKIELESENGGILKCTRKIRRINSTGNGTGTGTETDSGIILL